MNDEFLRRLRPLPRAPGHIKKVVLHTWLSGRAVALHPDPAPLFGPLYNGLAPSHHSLSPTPPTAGEGGP